DGWACRRPVDDGRVPRGARAGRRGRLGLLPKTSATRHRLLLRFVLEVIPLGIRGAADPREAQREVVRVGRLPPRLFVTNEAVLPPPHHPLLEGLHPVS